MDVGGQLGQHQQLIPEESGLQTGGIQLGFVAGVILRERLPAFERMLWRACRGNVFLRQAEIEDALEDPLLGGDEVYKSVFVIFFQGEQLKSRVKKICEGFRATLYPCPDQAADRREMAVGVMQRLEDLNTVLGQTNDHRHRVLVAAAKNIKVWFIKVRKIKAIYHTLNYFNLDVTQKCLIAECWIPTADIEAIQLALRRGTEKSGSTVAPILNQMATKDSPPTSLHLLSRSLSMPTAWHRIVRPIRLFSQSSRFRSCLQSCLVMPATDWLSLLLASGCVSRKSSLRLEKLTLKSGRSFLPVDT